MEYEKCYVFQPDDAARPVKRPRLEPRGLQASWPLRKRAYQEAWQSLQARISSTLDNINSATVSDIARYLDEARQRPQTRIPTCLVLGGPHATLQSTITDQLSRLKSEHGLRIFASLSPGSSTNLKALLRTLIQKATARVDGLDDEEDELATTQTKGPKLLNYDLQILADFVNEKNVDQVVVAFEGTEAFDSHLLSELIDLMGCWQDRIPFVCLFNIATSVDFLQQRLSSAAVKCLSGKMFDVAPSAEVVEQVFDVVANEKSHLWIGPNLAGLTLERQSDYIQGINSLVDAVQYAYMSCFYANALSVFLIPDIKLKDVPADHFEALRSLKSFRATAQALVKNGESERVTSLLDSDEALFTFAQTEVERGREKLSEMVVATSIIRALQSAIPGLQPSTKSNLYVQALSGTLEGSALVRSLLLSIRKSTSDTAMHILPAIMNHTLPQHHTVECKSIVDALGKLILHQKDSTQPLRSADDVKNSTLRTTVIAQKVELSKQKSALSEDDAAYTALLRRLTDMLEQYFEETLVPTTSLPLHEIFLYDLRSPHREVLTPRPRHAVERALASPHDYLDCDCCGPKANPEGDEEDEAMLAATQPATAVLYQLYLESGNLINASDLWQAFSAVMGDDKDEQQLMALFQRGLAELKYLGFVKGTRKRADHVAKVAWKGL